MADVEQARVETERAFKEAGIDDADLSYLTQEFVDKGEREARDAEEMAGAEVEGEAAPEWGNRLWNVWFTGGPGSSVYGYLLKTDGTCGGSWYAVYTWNVRQLLGRCPNRASYIWRVG
jgi:hypothetical protein